MAMWNLQKFKTYQKVSQSRDMSHTSMGVGFDALRLC